MMQPPLSPAQRPAVSRSLARVPSLTSLYVQALTPRVDTVTRLASRLRRDAPHATVEHRSLPEVTYVVDGVRGDPVEVARYCTVVGAARSEVMPAGYVHVLAFPVAMALMVSAQFPLPVAGMVHVANSVEVARPVLVGETLTVAAWARNLAEHAKGTQVDLVTEVSVQGRWCGGVCPPTWLRARFCAAGVKFAHQIRLSRLSLLGHGRFRRPLAGTTPPCLGIVTLFTCPR